MLEQGTLSATKTQIYSTPAATKAQIKTIKIHNSAVTIEEVKLYSLKSSSLLFDVFVLNPKDSIEVSPAFPLEYTTTGYGIEAETSNAASVNYFIGGVESAL